MTLMINIFAIIIYEAWTSDSSEYKDMCLNTRAIVFYSTPHTGSRVAKLSQATSLVLLPSIEVRELQEGIFKFKYYSMY